MLLDDVVPLLPKDGAGHLLVERKHFNDYNVHPFVKVLEHFGVLHDCLDFSRDNCVRIEEDNLRLDVGIEHKQFGVLVLLFLLHENISMLGLPFR
jgi:hypothetical protein